MKLVFVLLIQTAYITCKAISCSGPKQADLRGTRGSIVVYNATLNLPDDINYVNSRSGISKSFSKEPNKSLEDKNGDFKKDENNTDVGGKNIAEKNGNHLSESIDNTESSGKNALPLSTSPPTSTNTETNIYVQVITDNTQALVNVETNHTKTNEAAVDSSTNKNNTSATHTITDLSAIQNNMKHAETPEERSAGHSTDNLNMTNIRKVREDLLDHLLEYFINIVKEEKLYIDTQKKYEKRKLNVEDKLTNYYTDLDTYNSDDNESETADDDNESETADDDSERRERISDKNHILINAQNNVTDVSNEPYYIHTVKYKESSGIPDIKIDSDNASDLHFEVNVNNNNECFYSESQTVGIQESALSEEIQPNTATHARNISDDVFKSTEITNSSNTKEAVLPDGEERIANNNEITLYNNTTVTVDKDEIQLKKEYENNIKLINENEKQGHLLEDDSENNNSRRNETFNDINKRNMFNIAYSSYDNINDGNFKQKANNNSKDEPVATKNNNDLTKIDNQSVVNLTTDILINKINCSPKVEDKSICHNVTQGKCVKDIILQFFIDMY